MLVHAHRHLPYTQLPHTRCYSPKTRSLTHSCPTHTHHSTHPRGGPHRGASLPHGCSHTRAISAAHAASSACGAPFTHGVLGSTHTGTLANTPLTHGVSSTLGVSSAYGVSLALGVCSTLGVPFTHGVALTPFTAHTGTLTPGILATSRAPGVSIPPKLRVHPFAALVPSNSRGETESTWSRPASRGHSVSLCSRGRLPRCPHRVSTRSASSPPLSSTTSVCVCVRH